MSSQLLVHELPERAKRITGRTREALQRAQDSDVRSMADALDGDDEGPIGLIFTGQYNAGKSTLISALTGRDDILIDSDVATNEVRSYEWGAVHLVDTPGVQAGRSEHDAMAEDAIRKSDLVVFVVSVDLPDDAAVQHLRHVALDLGKRPSMVAVVNKSGMLQADASIRVASVRDELGPGQSVPVVITDARDYLDAQSEEDPEFREELLRQGNVDGLAAALNGLVTRSGQESRLRRPFEKVIAVCTDALEVLSDDPADQAARKVINRQRRLVLASRRRLELAFDSEFSDYRRKIVSLGEDVADAVDAMDHVEGEARQRGIEAAEASFRAKAESETDYLLDRIQQRITEEARLASQESQELAASPQVGLLKSVSADWEPFSSPAATRQVDEPQVRDYHRLLEDIGQGAGAFAAKWAPEAAEKTSQYAGSFGHKTIYSIGKMAGKNWRPWEAVRWAKNVGQAAKFVNKAMPFVALGVDVFIAIKADVNEGRYLSERQARHRRTIDESLDSANEVITEVKSNLDVAISEFYGPALRPIDAQQQALDDADSVRSGIRGGLAASIADCRENLELLDGLSGFSGSTGEALEDA